MGRKALAIAALVAFALLTLRAQGPQTAQGVKPAQTTRDLKTTLFDAGSSLGMLRTVKFVDSITTQEVVATGTMNAGGQASKLTNYRVSINYNVSGMRVDLTRTGPGGQAQRQVQVVSGDFAWNETEPGVSPTPAPGTARERLVQLWTTPIGLVKAATAAGGAAKVAAEGGNTVLTFPLPAPVADVTVKATLSSAKGLFINWTDEPEARARIKGRKLPIYPPTAVLGLYIVRVETQLGNTVTETTYSEYGDWNLDDAKGDIMWPRRIVQKQGNGNTLELRITQTNTYNPYVVMRVPDNVRKAGAK